MGSLFSSLPSGDNYNPDNPMLIAQSDLIAARNAVSKLIVLLTDEEHPPSDYLRESVRVGVRIAVVKDGEAHEFPTFQDAVEWLTNLRDRLTRHLPTGD